MFVLSENVHRRHLTASQRAILAVELVNCLSVTSQARRNAQLKRGPQLPVRSKLTQRGEEAESGKAVDQAAKILSVSAGYVRDALQITAADPELAKKILAGEATIGDGIRMVNRDELEKKLEDTSAKKAKALAGLFNVIVADPPWPLEAQFGPGAVSDRGA